MVHSLACLSTHSQTGSPLHIQTCVCLQAHMHVFLSPSRLPFLDKSHHDYSSSSILQQPHAYSAFSNAGDHKMLCWCCSQFCVQRYMGTVAWMGLRGGPCYLLAVSWLSLAKLSCTCTASSWKLSDRGEMCLHLYAQSCSHHSFAKIHAELRSSAAVNLTSNKSDMPASCDACTMFSKVPMYLD